MRDVLRDLWDKMEVEHRFIAVLTLASVAMCLIITVPVVIAGHLVAWIINNS